MELPTDAIEECIVTVQVPSDRLERPADNMAGSTETTELLATSNARPSITIAGPAAPTEVQTIPMDGTSLSMEQNTRRSSLSLNLNPGEEFNEGDHEEADESDDEEEGVEEDEVVEETEMTSEEKKTMYDAVKRGDIDALEDCLDKPNSDINIICYKENLLMAAIRHGQAEMAEFLLDNGVDYTYCASIMELKATPRGLLLDRYDMTCRQMAYDHELLNIVQLIDRLEGNVFRFLRPPDRTPRYRRTKPSTVSEFDNSSDEGDDEFSSNESESDKEGSIISGRKSEEKKKRTKRDDDEINNEEDKDDNDAATVLDDVGYEEQHLDNSGETIRKRKMKKKESVDKVVEEELDNDKAKETMSMTDLDPLRHILGTSTPNTVAPQKQRKVSENPTIKSSSGIQCSSQEKIAECSTKGIILNNKETAGGQRIEETCYRSLSLKSAAVKSLPDLKQSWKAETTNRIWSSKSALSIRKVHSCRRPSRDDIQGDADTRPLRWKKVSTLGSYTTESRHWHKDEKRHFRSSGEITEIKLPPLSTSSLSMLESGKCSSSTQRCAHKPHASCSSLVTSMNDPPSSNVNTSTSKTTSFSDNVRRTKYKTTKRKLSPRFMNCYEALDFVPYIKANLRILSQES